METQTQEAPLTKKCIKCGAVKPFILFEPAKNNKNGITGSCKECRAKYKLSRDEIERIRKKKYAENNKEKIAERKHIYQILNKEKIAERKRKKYQEKQNKRGILPKIRIPADKEKLKQTRREQSKAYRGKNIEKNLLSHARKRASIANMEINITVEDIILPSVCPVLGISLYPGNGVACHNSPSLDRIDSSKGYVKGNVRVISYRANALKNNASFLELTMIYKDAMDLLVNDGRSEEDVNEYEKWKQGSIEYYI